MATIVTEFVNLEGTMFATQLSLSLGSPWIPAISEGRSRRYLACMTCWLPGHTLYYVCGFSSLLAVGVVQTTKDAVWHKKQLRLQTKA